ncbi:MAG: response regulator [Synechococcales bacterium]|nr:response regulator [Synechococcales bacterium]
MKILLVEDNQLLAEQLVEALTLAHFTVDTVSNGVAAWEYLVSLPCDLVILDWMMPKMDGITLCRRLRDKGIEIPILIMTAKGMKDDKVQGLDCGADDYLVKPVSIEELMARIRALMRRSDRKLALQLEWGKLCLNPNTCEVTYDSQPILLTPKEYGIVELLLRNPQRIYSRQAILDQLWSFSGDLPGDDTIKSHIKCLRQKLKGVGADNLIETVYGMGYRLSASSEPHTALAQQNPNHIPPQQPDAIKSRLRVDSGNFTSEANLTQDSQLRDPSNKRMLAQPFSPEGVANPQATIHSLSNSQLSSSNILYYSESANAIKILLVDTDPVPNGAFLSKLKMEAIKAGIQLTVIHRIASLLTTPQLENYDLMLLAISKSQSISKIISSMLHLLQRYPALQIAALTDHHSFSDRQQLLSIANQGLLDRRLPPQQLLLLLRAVMETRATNQVPILMVTEDEASYQHLAWLLAAWNCHLLCESDLEKLWSTLDKANPKLLILDHQLPQANTAEICQVLRSDLRWNWLSILILGRVDSETFIEYVAAGADDVVQKPIVETEVVNVVLNRIHRNKTLWQHYQALRSIEGTG